MVSSGVTECMLTCNDGFKVDGEDSKVITCDDGVLTELPDAECTGKFIFIKPYNKHELVNRGWMYQ